MALEPPIAAAVASLQAQRDKLDLAIKALLALDDGDDLGTATEANEILRSDHGVRSTPPRSSVGGGRDGARKVLRAAPGRKFTAAQLAQAMLDNGWVTSSTNPRAAARASANRLRDEAGEHVYFADGKFVYSPPSEELEGLRDSTLEGGKT